MLEENIIIIHSEPKSPVSKAYRVIRTNIQYYSVDKAIKTIVITSSVPLEGKTTITANLAISFAQMGSKVLLIDADLRKPKIHKIFWVRNNKGLTNYLTCHDDYHKYVRQSSIQNLNILTSGVIPPNPSELLNSEAMKQFIKDARNEYDIILMDSPPVCNVTDASIISTYADGTILVVNSGKVTIEELKNSAALLKKVNANLIGAILNNYNNYKTSGRYYYEYQFRYLMLCKKRRIEIPANLSVGKGLYLGHPYNITINGNAVLGKNINIHKGVTIGQENRGKRKGTPTIGNKVWIGVNSVVVGKITIGDDVLIAPGSYVNFDIPSHSIVLGNPCRIIPRENATQYYIENTVE